MHSPIVRHSSDSNVLETDMKFRLMFVEKKYVNLRIVQLIPASPPVMTKGRKFLNPRDVRYESWYTSTTLNLGGYWNADSI